MGYYPYEQECIHGHRWFAAFSSVDMTDSGKDRCPECHCHKVRVVWQVPGQCWVAHSGKQEGAWGNYNSKPVLQDDL